MSVCARKSSISYAVGSRRTVWVICRQPSSTVHVLTFHDEEIVLSAHLQDGQFPLSGVRTSRRVASGWIDTMVRSVRDVHLLYDFWLLFSFWPVCHGLFEVLR